MKKIVFLSFMFLGIFSYAQSIDYNIKKGYAAHGYDVVAYFDDHALEGQTAYSTTFDGVDYKFSSKENLDKFLDKLYLFYNKGKTNTLELWKKASPERLQSEADANWEKIKSKK